MEALARYLRSTFTEEGEREVTFAISSPLDLSKEKHYVLTLSEKKGKRSLNQNALMWAVIRQIALKEDGNYRDIENIYLQCLEQAGVEPTEVLIKEIALDAFRSLYRHIKVVDRQIVGHTPYVTLWAFKGSSEMDKAEMGKLIDIVLDRAEQNGIYSEYYKSLMESL